MGTAAGNAHLPELVRSYLARSLPPDGRVPASVRVQQTGEMWRKRGGRPMSFQATEDFAVDRVAFSWRARFPIVGPLALTVVDEFAAGEGQLRVSLLGLPLQTQRGPETAVGEAMRYLAELALVPQAIATNRELEWREVGERAVEVACEVGSTKAAVQWEFDDVGDLVRVTGVRPSWTGRQSCQDRGAATSGSTRASRAFASPSSRKCGGSYPRAASSTGAAGSRRSS